MFQRSPPEERHHSSIGQGIDVLRPDRNISRLQMPLQSPKARMRAPGRKIGHGLNEGHARLTISGAVLGPCPNLRGPAFWYSSKTCSTARLMAPSRPRRGFLTAERSASRHSNCVKQLCTALSQLRVIHPSRSVSSEPRLGGLPGDLSPKRWSGERRLQEHTVCWTGQTTSEALRKEDMSFDPWRVL